MAGGADRSDRLAEALRANLRRRKAARDPSEATAPEQPPRDPSPREDAEDQTGK
jgi:hypothetical protein